MSEINHTIEFINDAYTLDGLRLPMVHFNPSIKDVCVIFIHGMCQTIIDNYFAVECGNTLAKNGIGFIYEHNRGHSIENDILIKDGTYKRYGCMYEIFEDCIFDIDLAIEKAQEFGYKRIILMGHSYGCNKVIYYNYQKKPKIDGIILVSAPDMIGIHRSNQKNYQEILEEAKLNIENNQPEKILSWLIEDYMYMSSQTYFNWYNDSSKLDNLPIMSYSKNWYQFEIIDKPMLVVSGENEIDTYLHLELLEEKAKNCPDFSKNILNGANHFYHSKEKELSNVLLNWIHNKFC